MEKFFEHNLGSASHISYTLLFKDYTNAKLLGVLHFQMNQFDQTGIDIEDGADEMYMQIAVRVCRLLAGLLHKAISYSNCSFGFMATRTVTSLLERLGLVSPT